MKIDDLELQLLKFLALMDAVFAPQRDFYGEATVAVLELRRDYSECGIPWAIGGSTAQRKAGSRELATLRGAGSIRTFAQPGRAVGVQLTESEEERLRNLACIESLDSALHLVDAMGGLSAEGRGFEFSGHRWFREHTLARYFFFAAADAVNSRLLSIQEEAALILGSHGFAENAVDCQGRAWYRLTPAGEARAKERQLSPPSCTYVPVANEAYRQAYLSAFAEAQDLLKGLKPISTREIGQCPIPVSVSDGCEDLPAAPIVNQVVRDA